MASKINIRKIGNFGLVSFLLALLILVLSFIYYKHEERQITEKRKSELESIALIKIGQIQDWYEDEINDAGTIAKNQFLILSLNNYLKSNSTINKANLELLLAEIINEHGYTDASLIQDGEIILSVNKDSSFSLPGEKIFNIINRSKNRKKVIPSSLYKVNNKIYISFISPFIEIQESAFAIVFTISADSFLYPLVNSWSSEYKTAETELIRQEGSQILFLNNLKFHEKSALNLRVPMSREDQLGTKALTGHVGMAYGIDYRGIEVFAYLSNIPSTPWYIVTKIDEKELLSELYTEMIYIILITMLFISIAVIGIVLLYSNRQKNIYKELYNKEKALWKSEEKFKVTLDSLGSGVITADLNGKVTYLNSMAEEMTGWKMSLAQGRNLNDVYNVKSEYTGEQEKNIINKVFTEGIVKELANHTLLIAKDGREIPVMDTGAPLMDDEGKIEGLVLVFQDESEKRNNERRLADSERRLSSTMEGMLEGCQIISPDWKYLYVNRAAAKHGRKTKEELIGNSMMDVYPGIENSELYAVLKKCLGTQTSNSMENKFVYTDGTAGWFELNIELVEEGLFILSIDITQRKLSQIALLASEEKYRELVENIDNVIFSMNMKGTIQFINKAVTKLLEYQPEEVIGHDFREFFEGDFLENAVMLHNEFFEGNSEPRDMQIKTKGGDVKWVKLLRRPVYSENNIVGMRGVLTDITARMNSMKALKRANEASEEMNRIKSQFFANMSHELRTPFVGIMGYAELLLENLKDDNEKEMVEGILSTSKRMKETLTKILDLSRLEFYPNEVKFVSVEASSVLHNIYLQMKPMAENKNLKLNFDYGEFHINLMTDQNLFAEIMNNLVSNAIIYTDQGEVNVSVEEKVIDQQRYMVFKVSDTGIGISDEKKEIVWEEFRQVSEGSTRIYQGTGLGLSIVKKYTEFLGGTVTLESEIGKGSVFMVELPADQNHIL